MSSAEHSHTESNANPWDRRPGETDGAWRAFQAYLHLGPNRTLPAAAEALGRSAKYKSTLGGWSNRHAWVSRCIAYDVDALRRASADVQPLYRATLAKVLEASLRQRAVAVDDLELAATKRREILEREIKSPGDAFAALTAARDIRAASGIDDPFLQEIISEQLADALEHDQSQGPLELLRDILQDVSPSAAYEVLEALRRRQAKTKP